MRDRIFAALLAIAGLLISLGVSTWSAGAALIAAGVLVVAWAWLVLVYGADDTPAVPGVPASPVPE